MLAAAAVLLALVASAQVQAFPGSDPVSSALTAAHQSEIDLAQTLGMFGFPGDNLFCLIKYVSTLQTELKDGEKVLALLKQAVSDAAARFQKCSTDADKFVCGCQAIRDTWEASQKSVLPKTETFAKQVIALVEKIQKDCFSSSKHAEFRDAVRPRLVL
ncbi:hypothetical protein ONE63_003999 [Megalurothrips usitatus]|uniref:Uncharacterized protein n=1 Tax=Megalurothrips usitatus TaxID=439358 RepID=A0AAV7XAS8_9NEOP|nr:hypothetical protein ONE63_003999 [Megalurothrips usitatus]